MQSGNGDKCFLCPRGCGAERSKTTGICGCGDELKVARASLHYWEEPCISGKNGSGTVFFSGCPLECIFCQNHEISRGKVGKEISTERLCEIFFELQEYGAHNINLVTPLHYAIKVAQALRSARNTGLKIPVVCNTSGYETPETLRLMSGLVDVYLPDFKYFDSTLADRFSHAPDYPSVAVAAISEMFRQCGKPTFDESGMITAGVVVRVLVLPSHTADAIKIIEYLYNTYKDGIYISIMNQYTPPGDLQYPELNRRLSKREYDKVVDRALEIGVTNAFVQSGPTAKESFIPDFDCRGV